jgi:hypothetical protein
MNTAGRCSPSLVKVRRSKAIQRPFGAYLGSAESRPPHGQRSGVTAVGAHRPEPRLEAGRVRIGFQ